MSKVLELSVEQAEVVLGGAPADPKDPRNATEGDPDSWSDGQG
ncbi:MAG: hypothetical protein R3B81_02615 [bacterium]